MSGTDSKITTQLAVDDAVAQTAGLRTDRNDRRLIDNQIRGIEQHLVNGLIRGRHATWVRLVGTSASVAIGQVVCSSPTPSSDGIPLVTLATPSALGSAGVALGVVVITAAPGNLIMVATGGIVPPTITGLGAFAGPCRVNASTYYPEHVGAFAPTDWPLGATGTNGDLTIAPQIQGQNLGVVTSGVLYTLDSGSAALSAGDRVAMLATGTNQLAITKGTYSAVKAAGGGLGMVLTGYAPGASNVVVAIGGTIPASDTGLGAGSAGPVAWDINGRLFRVLRDTGTDIAGVCDATGKVTLREASHGFLNSHKPVYNILDYGGTADCYLANLTVTGSSGTPTDNIAAFNAAKAAIAASGLPGTIYFPASPRGVNYGYYFASEMVIDVKGIEILGDAGASNDSSAYATWFCGGLTPGVNITHVKRAGSGASFKNIAWIHPYSYSSVIWHPSTNFQSPSQVVPLRQSYNYVVVPHNNTGTSNATEFTGWPQDWDWNWTPYAGTQIVVWIADDVTPGLLHPYIYQAMNDGATSASIQPYDGQAPAWAAGQSYTTGQFVRPTDPNYTGEVYEIQSTTGTGVTAAPEPSWAGIAPGGVLTLNLYTGATPTGTITYYRPGATSGGQLWPRTVGQTITEAPGVTWKLVSTSGQITGDGTMLWDIKPMSHALVVEGITHAEHCLFYSINGRGISINASVGGGTAANGCSFYNISIGSVSGDGIYVIGDDANACQFESINILGAMGWGIYDHSFLGNTWTACQIAPRVGGYDELNPTHGAQYGRGPVHSIAVVSNNGLYGIYAEGGQPPSRVSSPSMVFSPLGGFGTFDKTSKPDFFGTGRTYPIQMYSTPSMSTWVAGRKVAVGETIQPQTNGHHKVFGVTSITGGSYDPTKPTFTSNTEPTWPSTNGATVTETGTNNGLSVTITYTCLGADQVWFYIGSMSTPDLIWDIAPSDYAHSLSRRTNTPYANEIADCIDKQVNQCISSYDVSGPSGGRYFYRICYELRGGVTADVSWRWQTKAASHFDGANLGSIDFTYDSVLGDPMGKWVTGKLTDNGGLNDHLVNAGKLWTSSEEIFQALRLTWGTQSKNDSTTGSIATAYPVVKTDPNVCITTNATITTLHTLDAVPTHKLEDVVVKVIAETVDGSNNPDGVAQAVWLLQGSCKESGGALVAVQSPLVIYGQPTDATHNAGGNSANWRAVIDFTSSNTPQVRVTGFGTDRIMWKCVVEPLR